MIFGTPLTSIIGYVNLIVEDDYQDKEKCREYMEVVERRLENMKEMTESLFSYTKLIQKDYTLKKETCESIGFSRRSGKRI